MKCKAVFSLAGEERISRLGKLHGLLTEAKETLRGSGVDALLCVEVALPWHSLAARCLPLLGISPNPVAGESRWQNIIKGRILLDGQEILTTLVRSSDPQITLLQGMGALLPNKLVSSVG